MNIFWTNLPRERGQMQWLHRGACGRGACHARGWGRGHTLRYAAARKVCRASHASARGALATRQRRVRQRRLEPGPTILKLSPNSLLHQNKRHGSQRAHCRPILMLRVIPDVEDSIFLSISDDTV